MSLASRAGDLYFSYRFIKQLVQPWNESDAFKLGIIDDEGKRIKNKKLSTDAEKSAFTTFHRLAFNVKRLLNKLPGGKNTLSSYAAALFLLREEFGLTDKGLEKVVQGMEINILDFIGEKNEWYVLEDKKLSPGIYKIREEKLTSAFQSINPKDKIRIYDESYPVGNVFGLDIYKATHINSDQPVYVTLGEIYK